MAVPRYHFDLYPRDDPRDGTRLVRFSNLQSAKFRLEANGVGVGEFGIRADDTEALHIDPRGLQYVRVVEEGIAESERVVGGFWLETGDFAALTEDSTELLKFGGPGTLAYLSREVLWSRAYNYAADNIIDESGTWHFYNQASLAGGDFLGGVAFRIITEGLTFAASPTEVDDKPDTAIPDVQLGSGLGAYSDSAGAAWTVPSGEFKAQAGDTLYSIVKRLMEAGLYIEMNPDTFELNVWERGAPNSRGDSKTGSAWAVVDPMTDERVIRFQSAPLDGDEAEGNVKSDAKRSVTPFLLASTVLAGDNGVYAAESNALDIKWHRYYPSSVADTDTLSYMADSQLSARGDAADTLRVRIKLGNDPANGIYYPFEWEPYSETGLDGVVMVNDTVTVHTGTGQWDYNEDTFPVAAITISVREGGDWDCWLDLGAAYSSMAERAFQARGTAPHSHPPNPELCRVGTPGTDIAPTYDYTWPFLTDLQDVEEGSHGWTGAVTFLNPRVRWIWTGQARVDVFSTTTPSGSRNVVAGVNYEVLVTVDSRTGSGTRVLDIQWLDNANGVIRTDVLHADLPIGAHVFTPPTSPTGTKGCRIRCNSQGSADLIVSLAALRHGGGVTAGTPGDGHPDLVGHSPRAARCDHRHDVHRTRAPLPADDWASQGYKLGTIWAQLDSLTDPTVIIGTWMLVDNSTGAAVWLKMGVTVAELQAALQDISGIGATSGLWWDGFANIRLLIGAHGGDIGNNGDTGDSYPQNSLKAHQQAALKGAHYLDVDCRLTSDSVWVAYHDAAITAGTNGTGNVSAITAATFLAARFDSTAIPGYNATRHGTSIGTATVAEIIEAIKQTGTAIMFECKPTDDAAATSLAELIASEGFESRAFIHVQTMTQAAAVKAVSAAIGVDADYGLSGAIASADVDSISMAHTNVSSLSYVTAIAPKIPSSNMPIASYGEDEQTWISTLYDRGVRMWTSNNLDEALAYLNQKLQGETGRWQVVTNGNAASPEVVFSDGDIVEAWVTD